MNTIKSLVLAALLAAAVQSATAQLIAQNSSFGANTVIEDTSTGLTWLRLDLTRGLSFNDVIAQTEQGGTFSGYRAASGSEIVGLFSSIGDCGGSGSCWSRSDFQTSDLLEVYDAIHFTTLFGAEVERTSSGSLSTFLLGYSHCMQEYPDLGCVVARDYGIHWGLSESGSGAGRVNTLTTSVSPRHGTWMVATPVPEPSTYALTLAGLSAVAFASRRRKAKTDQLFA